ncbi:patatin-like phospholipase family protein [Parabacteroides sp. FAFU027]|uniref:patatin-like phospholipase family protein n=1 Tax=Parabacteroides sp. FAFU027 TaxID=2922715 RepID=UPI001FAF106E|nr:patatin-like phospholipase family protein [Parabacteroides sp. FAFU027]
MNKFITLIIITLSNIFYLPSQSVGLVLSGGGAKGIAHIGIIKALEDNNIPIDYVTGTSIGAIIGSLYAMGYSPEEMLQLIKSENFRTWQTGKVNEKDLFYYKIDDPTPEFGRFRFETTDSTRAKTYFLPVSLINPIQMNLGILKLYTQASAAANNDFDQLMIPFRCVAADIYHKEPIIFRSGSLCDAVRASMTFPFVFKPIEIDGNLAYDGGIYNNFPVDVMQNDFHPDYIIGSVVVKGKYKPDEKNIISQLENMIMQKTDYSIGNNRGVVIRSDLSDINLLDFDKADKVFEIGYRKGLEYVSQIKRNISRDIPPDSLSAKRSAFKKRLPNLVFQNVIVKGVSKNQTDYILFQVKNDDRDSISFDDFRKAYFRLLSDEKIAEILPEAIFNRNTRRFDLILKVKIKENLSAGIGGLISSASSNQVYLGLKYQAIKFYSFDINADAQIGNSYNAFHLSGRVEMPTVLPLYLKITVGSSAKKYFESSRLFSNENLSAYLKQSETFSRLSIGTPFYSVGKAIFSASTGKLTDEYSQGITSTANIALDESTYNLSGLSVRLEKNTLNAVMYPTAGTNACFLLQAFTGKESFYKNENEYLRLPSQTSHTWAQAELRIHRYFQCNSKYALGTLLNVVASNKSLFNNYAATILQAPAFTPTPHSKMVFNESLRATNYIAGGIIPLVKDIKKLQLRGEFYGFLPYRKIIYDEIKNPAFDKGFGKLSYFGELSLIYNFPIASLSIYGNHYSFPGNNWNMGINIGFLLYNPHFIE